MINDGGITSLVGHNISSGSAESTEETVGWPAPASRAIVTSAATALRLASVDGASAVRR